MTQFLLPPGFRATDADDNPLAGGYYKFYAGGTTTPKAVFSDAALSTSLGSQVNLNSAGAPVSGSNTPVLIYLNTGTYKAELYDADDTLLFTFDAIPGAEEEVAEVTTALPTTPVISKTGPYTVTVNERGKLINANPTGGSFAITMPSAVTMGDNFRVGVRHAGSANQVSVVASGGQFIRAHKALRSYPLTGMGETIWLVSDGSDWIVDSYHPPFWKADSPYFIVLDRLTAPPANPDAGARYLINGEPTGLWASLSFEEHDIAEADGNGSWIQHTPESGWRAFDQDEEQSLVFRDGQWENFQVDPGTSILKQLWVQDQKTGTSGGTATTGAWTTSTLNTSLVNTIEDSSLASSTITLPAGTYEVLADKTFFMTKLTRTRFRAVDDSITPIYSVTAYIGDYDANSDQRSEAGAVISLKGRFTITTSTDFRLEYRVSEEPGGAFDGLGNATGVNPEVYANVLITDLSSLQGPKGDQGDQGNTGDQGDPGVTVPDISGLTEDTVNNDETDYLIEYDASAALHKKVLPKNLGFTQAGTGATLRRLQSKLREAISLEDFGVVSGLDVADAVAEANVTNAQAALDYAGLNGARIIAPGQYYVFKDDGLRFPTGVHVYGNGVDYWDPIFPQNPKGWKGTNFIAKGSSGATTKHTITGITSMRYAGGRREDPNNGGEYFELTSLMEDDASGTTPATAKQLSVFITGEDDAVNWGLHGVRVVPWIGTDGVSDYSNQSNAALSQPWDIGILLEDHEGVDISDVQSVGHWRIWGCAIVSPGFADFGHSERNSIRRCRFQGLTGFALRGGDQWAVSATTSTTATIRWSEESYWPSGAGGFEAVGSGGTADYTYTGTTRVGDDLRFDGVSPNPSSAGVFQLRNPNDGTGFAGTQIEDVYCYGLDHESGDDSETMGLGISKAFEMSGSPMRGVQAFNFKCHTNERVIAYLHDVQDFLSFGWQVEGPGHILASPATGSSTATAPVGDTGNLRIYAGVGFVDVQDDLWNPRSQYRDGDQINPRDENEGHFLLKCLASQDFIVELATGRDFIVRNDDEVTIFSIDEATGQATFPNQTNFTGEVTGSANVRAGSGSALYWSGRSQMRSPADGRVQFRNAANNAYSNVEAEYLDITDGITAPGAGTGRARIYVDTADGDLKVVFADGTVKTLATDT
jgi:hypothetical protein